MYVMINPFLISGYFWKWIMSILLKIRPVTIGTDPIEMYSSYVKYRFMLNPELCSGMFSSSQLQFSI